MTKLYLLRHGETTSNYEKRYQGQGDSHLTPLGRKQSERLAEVLKDEPFSAVYSSDLNRSFETARMVAKFHKLEVQKVPELKERNYGVWEGLTFQEIESRYSEIYKSWLANPAKTIIPEAETLEELQKRGIRAVSQIMEKHPNETIAVVAHGGLNRMILMYYLGMDLNNFWSIKQFNCAVNIIEYGSRPVVLLLNGNWFLKGLEEEVKGIY